MRYLKIYSILILFIIFKGSVNAQQTQYYNVCSGENVKLEVTDIFEGSVFEWAKFKNGEYINIDGETNNNITVSLTADSTTIVKYRCIYKFNGNPYKTTYFEVTFNPDNELSIEASNLCHGQFALFEYSSKLPVKNHRWVINGEEYLTDIPRYYIEKEEDIHVSLTVTDSSGCISHCDSVFHVFGYSDAVIERIPQVTNEDNKKEIICGNSVTSFKVSGLESNYNLIGWNIYIQEESQWLLINNNADYIDKITLDNNTISIKWQPFNPDQKNSGKVKIEVIYSNGNCEYSSEMENLLITDNSPTEFVVHQKPNSSLLILPEGQYSDFNYLWGFTSQNGENTTFPGEDNNRFFFEYSSLDESNKYWVETWSIKNKTCRVRNYLDELVIPHSSEMTINLYPNPTSDIAYIEINNPVNGTIQLISASGVSKKVLNISKTSGSYSIDVNDYKPGNYLMVIESSSGEIIQTQNLIISK